MPLLAAAVLFVQFCLVYHVFKTGRPYWWMFVIMSFPVMGALVYFLVEIFPNSRHERNVLRLGNDIAKAINPDRDLHRRAEELAICGSMDNKLKMATECVERGMFDDAIRLYDSARESPFGNAPDLTFGLARAHFFNGNATAARQLLEGLKAEHPGYHADEVALLAARAEAGSGDKQNALLELEQLVPHFVGLEARYRHAELLREVGHTTQAASVLKDLLEHAQRFRLGPQERAWVKASKRELAQLG